MSDQLVIQFSTTQPDWRRFSPSGLRGWPFNLLFDKNWASGLIRRSCHSPFSHVDIQLEDGNLLGASDFPTAPVIKGNPRGVAIRPPNYQRFGYRRCMILATHRADDIRAIACTQIGKKFDNGALRGFISDKFPGERDWRLDDCWFCGELVAFALEVGGFWTRPLIWPRNRVSPTDLILVLLMDERFINADRFWAPVPGLKMDEGER